MPEKPLEGRSALSLEIRRLRLKAAMSQLDVGGLMGWSSATSTGGYSGNVLLRWENGYLIPTVESLRKFAEVVNADPEPLILLRNAEKSKRKKECRALKYKGKDLDYAAETSPYLESEWKVYRTKTKNYMGRVSFVAGWNAACATETNFCFNG